MGVTFTIWDNHTYCQENKLIGETVYECQCVNFPEYQNNCRECNGTKKVRFDDVPYELNICYSTLHKIFELSHVIADEVGGEMDPEKLLPFFHNVADYFSNERGHPISGAVYGAILIEAIRRKQPVCWS